MLRIQSNHSTIINNKLTSTLINKAILIQSVKFYHQRAIVSNKFITNLVQVKPLITSKF